MKKLPILLVISLIFSNLEVPNNKYCIMITESKVTEFFCIADDFCKEFEIRWQKTHFRVPLMLRSGAESA